MRKSNRKVIALFSDPHTNHSLGLLHPETKLPANQDVPGDTWTPALTPAQEWLYDHFEHSLKELDKFVGKDDLFFTVGGDVCQGNKHKNELVSMRDADQILMAVQVLDPVMRMKQLKRIIIVKGTDAHELIGGSLSILVSEQLRGKYPGKVDNYYHPILDIDGVRMDVTHHGPSPGRRAWLKGNELGWYVKDIMLDELANGRRPPDIISRSHFHTYVLALQNIITDRETFYTLGIVLPSFTMLDSHSRQVAKSPYYIRVGMLAIEVIDGKINYKPQEFIKTLDLRKYRRL